MPKSRNFLRDILFGTAQPQGNISSAEVNATGMVPIPQKAPPAEAQGTAELREFNDTKTYPDAQGTAALRKFNDPTLTRQVVNRIQSVDPSAPIHKDVNGVDEAIQTLSLPTNEGMVRKYLDDKQDGKPVSVSSTMEKALLGFLPGVVATLFGGEEAGANAFKESGEQLNRMREEDIAIRAGNAKRQADYDKALFEAQKTDFIAQKQVAMQAVEQANIDARDKRGIQGKFLLEGIKATHARELQGIKSGEARQAALAKLVSNSSKFEVGALGKVYHALNEKFQIDIANSETAKVDLIATGVKMRSLFMKTRSLNPKVNLAARDSINRLVGDMSVSLGKANDLGALAKEDLALLKKQIPSANDTTTWGLLGQDAFNKALDDFDASLIQKVQSQLGSKTYEGTAELKRKAASIANGYKLRKSLQGKR